MNEKYLFGNPESVEYSFKDNFNMVEKTKRYYKLQEETESLKKNVNTRVDQMFEQSERDYTELTKKKDRVMIDKANIEEAIKELDQKKNETLMNTFLKVNTYFTNIFQTLLPGASAILELDDLQDIQKGVKIKVGFGN